MVQYGLLNAFNACLDLDAKSVHMALEGLTLVAVKCNSSLLEIESIVALEKIETL